LEVCTESGSKRTERLFSYIESPSEARGAISRTASCSAQVALAAAWALSVSRWQERRFTNRYGQSIYEDIITLKPSTTGGYWIGMRQGR